MTGRRTLRRTLALALALSACSPANEAELLEVHGVRPDRIEPGHALEIRGAGFPPGRSARVRLEGRMFRPGRTPRDVRVELWGEALSSERVDARFTPAALDALGGRGTLHGRVVVSFEARGHGLVVGRSPAVLLDVTPPSTARLDDALARARRATLLAGQLGLGLGEEAPDVPGLPVESVEEGSPAARAGIVPTDRVIAIDGVRVHALADLLPPPGATRTTLELSRVGEASTVIVRLPLAAARDGLADGDVRAAQLALVWTLAILLLLAPSARLFDVPRPEGAPARRILIRAAIGAAFFAGVAGLALAGRSIVPIELLLAAFVAARVSAAFFDRREHWARALAGALGASLLAAIALGGAAALGGTSDLVALHALGGALPWEWPALRTPAGPLLAVLLLLAGAYRVRGRAAAALEEASALLLAAAVAAVLLGGWSAPVEGPAGRALGVLLYVASGLACWAAMRRLGRASARRRAIVAALLAPIAVFATAAWIAFEPPPIERALAEALTAVLGLVGAVLLGRRVLGNADGEPAPALPFL